MDLMVPGLRSELDRKLGQLTGMLHQVVGGSSSGNSGEEPTTASPAIAAAAAAAAAQAADVELQQLLQEAAERIADFQRRSEHQRQALELESALAPLRQAHEEERAALGRELADVSAARTTLQAVVERLGTQHASVAAALEEQRQAAAESGKQVAGERDAHLIQAGALRQSLAAAEAREMQLQGALQQLQTAAAADATRMQAQLQASKAEAQQQAAAHAAEATAWQQQRDKLCASHALQQQGWEGERQGLQQQVESSARQLEQQAQRAAAAEREAGQQRAAVEQLRTEAAAQQAGHARLVAALDAAQEEGTSVRQALAVAEGKWREAKQRGSELWGQVAALTQQLSTAHAVHTAAQQAHTSEVQRLEGELAASRTAQCETLSTLHTVQQQLGERQGELQELQAQHVQQLAAEKAHGEELGGRLDAMQASRAQLLRDSDAAQAAAAQAAALLQGQLDRAQAAEQHALQVAAEAEARQSAEAQLREEAHAQELASVQASAAAQLEETTVQAAGSLAAAERRAAAAARAQAERAEERELMRQAAAAGIRQVEARWEAAAGALAAKMQQLAANLSKPAAVAANGRVAAEGAALETLLSAQDAELTAEDMALLEAAVAAAVGEEPPTAAIDTTAPDARADGSSTAAGARHAVSSCVEQGDSPPLAAAHAMLGPTLCTLRQLYSIALEVRAQLGAQQQECIMHKGLVEGLQQQLASERQAAAARLEACLRQARTEGELHAREAAAAVAAEWKDKLATTEEALHTELGKLSEALSTAQGSACALSQQCAVLAAEQLAARQAHEAELSRLASAAERNRAAAAEQAAEAAATAEAARQREEAALREEMAGALLRAAERHQVELAAGTAQRAQQAEEAQLLGEQRQRHHEQELVRAQETAKLRLEAECARLAQRHAEQLSAAEAQHKQSCTALEQRHAGEVGRLREAIALLERGERQLIKARAALEAKASQLAAAGEAAAIAAAAQLAAVERRLGAALEAAVSEAAAALAAVQAEREVLSQRVVALEARIGREPRSEDIQLISELQGEVQELQERVRSSDVRYERLRQEVLLREETYNKTFSSGGAGRGLSVGAARMAQEGLTGWMLKAGGGGTGGRAAGGGSRPMSGTRLPAPLAKRG